MRFRWWWLLIIAAVLFVWWRSYTSLHTYDPGLPPRSPMSDDFNLIGTVFNYSLVVFCLVYPFIKGSMEYQETRSPIAFIHFASVIIFLVGFHYWTHYFVDHGAFFLWPLFIVGVIFGLQTIRAFQEDRRTRERAEELKEFPSPPHTGGAARKDDFKDWV